MVMFNAKTLILSRPARLMVMVVSLALGLVGIAQEAGQDAEPPSQTPTQTTTAVPSHRQADNVAIITIEGPIDRVTSYSFSRRLAIAEASGADAIVIELDTPGGQVGAVLEICDAIRNSPITNSVAWINPTAYSGGAIIALSCKEIVTTRSARMGDALPIRLSEIGMLIDMPEAERQKITAPLLGEVVGSARLRGWDEFVVQGFVALGVELWWVRDTQTGEQFAINEAEYRMLFDGQPPRTRPILSNAPKLSTDTPDAQPENTGEDPDTTKNPGEFRAAGPRVAAIEVDSVEIGRESTRRVVSESQKGQVELIGYLCTGDGPLILDADQLAMLGFAANLDGAGALDPVLLDADLERFFGAKHLRRLAPNWSEALVVFSTHPATRGVLLVVFLLMLFLEMSHPGVGLPGALAMVALVGLLGPPALIGLASWWEIGAIAVGIMLMFVEVFLLPGFGIPGIAGLLLLFGGMLGTFVGDTTGIFPDSPQEQENMFYGMLVMVLSIVTASVGMYYIAKNFGSIPILGRLILTDDNESGDGLLGAIPVERDALPRIGSRGKAVTPLRPSGDAQFGEKIVDVVSDLGYVDAGTRVRVVAADEFRVVVEAIDEESA